MDKEREAGSSALEKALIVLETLQSETEPVGVNELAKTCGMSAATVYRILRTLKARGWAYQDGDEKYSAGRRLCAPGGQNRFREILKECAYFTMRRLSEQEHEAMNLVVRDLDKCFILAQSRSGRFLDYVPPVGTVLPFHASACGKILLSELPEPILGEVLKTLTFPRMTARTITDEAAFREELLRVRENGFALDAHESQDEGFCIAVPVRSDEGAILAALSFSGFIGMKTEPEIERYVALLNDASQEITAKVYGERYN